MVPLFSDASTAKAAHSCYNDNDYLVYLVNDNVLDKVLAGDASNATATLTGYQIKDIMDYYDYLLSILLVSDDALCYYGDELGDAEFEAFCEAILGKTEYVHEKLNGLLEAYEADGTLPPKVEQAVNKIKKIDELLTKHNDKIKSIINKYLNSDLSQNISQSDKADKALDLLFGTETPTVTVDTLYAVFYRYDENVQAKLKELVDSGKLEAAIEKFESTALGSIFKQDGKIGTIVDRIDEIKNSGKVQGAVSSVYDLLVLIADYGIDVFKVDTTDVTIVDSYKTTVGGVTIEISRYFE